MLRPSIFRWSHIIKSSILGIFLFLGLTLSKLYAVGSFMHFFPRDMRDQYDVALHIAPIGLLMQLIGVMGFAPLFALKGIKMNFILQLLQAYTGGYIGLWELDLSMSPVLWLLLAAGLLGLFKKLFNERLAFFPREKKFWLALVIFLFAVELALEATFARGWFYPHLRELPFLKALHINPRFGSAFIMPLAILGATAFSYWTGPWPEKRTLAVFMPLNLLVLVSLGAYLLLPVRTLQRRDFDITGLLDAYKEIERGETFPIEKIASLTDQRTFDQHASNLRPYEVLFGYNKETFAPQVVAGPVDEIRDGAFNMTDPTGLVYPEVNGSSLWSRIPENERAELEDFTNHRNTDWKIPFIQQFWNIIAVVTLLGELMIFAFLFARRLKAKSSADTPGTTFAPEKN